PGPGAAIRQRRSGGAVFGGSRASTRATCQGATELDQPSGLADRRGLLGDRSQPRDGGRADRPAGNRAGARPTDRRRARHGGSLRPRRRARTGSGDERSEDRAAPRLRHDRRVNLNRTPPAPMATAFGVGVALAAAPTPDVFWIRGALARAASLACLALGRAP